MLLVQYHHTLRRHDPREQAWLPLFRNLMDRDGMIEAHRRDHPLNGCRVGVGTIETYQRATRVGHR